MSETIPIKIEDEEAIFVHATESENAEFIVICESGNSYLLDHVSRKHRLIGQLCFPLRYSEDFMAIAELSGADTTFIQVATFRNYVCITQKYGTEGAVFNVENARFVKNLKRGDYNVGHCTFPIAFYSDNNSTYLVHGTDWNKLDITLLESDKLMTDRVVDYESNSNYFDYFHSSLSISPDSKRFTSNGWVWQPYDVITVYELAEFLTKFELSNKRLDFGAVDGYNWDRPLCWIDNTTIGVGYNKKEAEDKTVNCPSEIIFVDVVANKVTKRIEFDGFALSDYGAAEGELFYDYGNRWFVSLNRQSGLLVSGIDGTLLVSNEVFTSHKYSLKHIFLYRLSIERDAIEITKLQ